MKNKTIEERIMMQKVILSCDIEKYMNGTYKKLAEQQPETHYLPGMDLKRRQMDK